MHSTPLTMSVHPADGNDTAGARAPELPIANKKKAWTHLAPAPPSDEPPALVGQEHTGPNHQHRRTSLMALLPEPEPSPVKHQRSNSSQDPPAGFFKLFARTPEPDVLGAQNQNHDSDAEQEDARGVQQVAVGLDLVDVNLIIIGSCGEAVELLRKRRREGGRAVLLWTNRPQQAYIKEKALTRDLRGAKLNMDSFVWRPPPASGPASPMVHRMRRQYGCAAVGMSRFGPDILDLRDVECYRVKADDSGHECGIEVYNEMRGNLLWAMSGAVVFCGPSYIGHGRAVCSSIDEVESLDVSVGFQEAMPLATTTAKSVVLTFLQNFAFLIAYFIIMGHFEAMADSKHWPWWRLSWVLGPGLSMGALIYPRYWGITLFGHHPPVWFCGLGAVVFITCTGSLYLPIGWAVGSWSTAVNMMTCSVFTASSGGSVIYVGTCVYLHLLSRRFSSEAQMSPLDWHHHSAWTCAHILTTLGTWVFLYGISLAYVRMELSCPQSAALFLAISTSVTEKVVSRILNFFYTTFIYTPRSSINGSKSILGDQRRYLTVPVGMTHAYCEAVRLVSLLSVTARSPSWAWMASVLLNVIMNLMERTQLLPSLLVRILPRCDRMCPGLSHIILHDVRLYTGYAQYVAVLGLLVAERVSGGLGMTSVLNKQCVILICCCIFVEILEDVLVLVLPRSDYWRRSLSPYYERQPVLHPKQLLLIDHKGTNYEAAPLALHGQRSLALVEVIALMSPSSLFTYVLMTLQLGAGYLHGVCDVPIPKEIRLVDALIWETPLRCV